MLKILVLMGSLTWATASLAKPAEIFPSSPSFEPSIQFWEKIFTLYKSDQIVIHDRDNLQLILDVIDLTQQGRGQAQDLRAAAYIEQVLGVYKKALHNFVVFGPAARTQSPLAAKIWNIYASDRESRLRLLQGKIELRCQAGLADTFSKALKVSELYLPQMERIFREHQLPVELTRLVYVESMFNLKARSKVGASGIWQLMPQAARAYLHIRGGRDERNSPLLATRAAAKIMQNNYATLQSWPLAITAYNHGLGGMRRAVTQTGSRGLGDIIAAYRSPSFGFASRNFYAEFLAVLRLHNRHYGNLKEPQLAEQGTRRDAALQDITQGK